VNTILKVVRYELRNVVRNRWVIAYALFFLITTELMLRLGGSTPRALLSLLNVVVLLIPLVTIVFGTIYWHGSREFTELLLAQPVRRGSLFHGLFAGLVLPLSAAFVLGVPDDRWGQRVVGVVVPTSSPAPTLDEVRDFVAAHLPRAWAPHQLLVLGALPLLPNGKPDRVQLGALASAAPGSGG